VLVIHTVWVCVVPMFTFPKFKVVIGVAETEQGATESIAVVRASPVPVRVIVWLPALSAKDNSTGALGPTLAGLKLTVTVHELPGAMPLVALGGVDSRILQVSEETKKSAVDGRSVLNEM
jgi:hypothetical protein